MLKPTVIQFLELRPFVSVATANAKCRPHAAPKFFLKAKGEYVYLVDYTIGRAVENLRVNPRASLSFMDLQELRGYRLDGSVEILEDGPEYQLAAQEFHKKTVSLSASRVIEASKTGKKFSGYELEIPGRFVVLKVHVDEVASFGPQGDILREKTR